VCSYEEIGHTGSTMTEIILDLGENGTILIDAMDGSGLAAEDSPTEKTGFGDTARQVGQTAKVAVGKVLRSPLTGLAKFFMATVPAESSTDLYDLDEFSVEFNLGIKTENGVDAGIVAKIMPEGGFKCTYTWKRKSGSAVPNLATAPIHPNNTQT
jgi:Trypsin-co-occurring domain 1